MDKKRRKRFLDLLGPHHFSDTVESRLAYSYDATPNFQSKPDAVVYPRHTQDVQGIIKLCQEFQIPIVPRGSGTNLSAGTCPSQGGIVMVFKNMDKILELDEENLTLKVQPGVVTQDIANLVESKGLFYPPDPSSMKISTIGGNVMENSGGLRGLKYGVTRDYILGLNVVLPNGDLIKTGGKLAKDVAGYDLTRLLVGSEGTLGIVTEILLKLLPLPESKSTMLASYDNIEWAAQTVSKIISSKIIPTTLEFLDKETIRVVEDFAKVGLPTDAEAILLIEQDGPLEIVKRDINRIKEICLDFNALEVSVAKTEAEAEGLRLARRSALSACARLKPTTILEDATVPRSMIAPMVMAIKQIAEKYEVKICTFGHAGDGNLHPTCLTDARDKEEMERVEKAFAEIFEKAIKMGGTITGEHGVGEMKSAYLELKLGREGIAVMKAIKQAMDPNNIMNPGKIFAVSPKKVLV